MIEEPFRWVEAIANRREYIEHQLSSGSPLVALSYTGGILLLTLSRDRRKFFEIYDRIAVGAIGHPGDIERLRMAAIEVASTEGFARSAQDVSLRRMAHYSLSPTLKNAFEQVYGAPILAKLLFAELGENGAPDLFLRLDYDGSIHANHSGFGEVRETFGVLGPNALATEAMTLWLRENLPPARDLTVAVHLALRAWAAGQLQHAGDGEVRMPGDEELRAELQKQRADASIEVMVLEQNAPPHLVCRSLAKSELDEVLKSF
jgi:proteasome alpha subunit